MKKRMYFGWCPTSYRFLVRAGTRSQIKHGEIGEDSKAAPEKVV